MCSCICICICVYVCMCICMYVYVVCVCVYIYIYIYIYISFFIKGHLRYKTINSQNVSYEAQVKIFFYFVEKLCSILEILKLLYF